MRDCSAKRGGNSKFSPKWRRRSRSLGSRYNDEMRRSNVALRPSLLEEVRRVSEAEGVALNQFINVAVAEKLSALRTRGIFSRAGQAKRLLTRRGKPPARDDQLN